VEYLGIDIGGTGIKGAPVDLEAGALAAPRLRILTPQPAKPEPMAEVIGQIARHFRWNGPIGNGFPGIVIDGVIGSAANLSKKWVGVNAAELIGRTTGCPTTVINDADAAGIAEMTFGAGKGRKGLVIIVTIGTGLGTALFTDGHLVPNCELGHIEINGQDAETTTSDAARKRDDLSWKKWARRFDLYLNTLERLFSPKLFILGGGASKNFEEFRPYLKVKAEILQAQLMNDAGIVGAAMAAAVYQGQRAG
jgi:polyphosphate glucokinase